ncbi:TIGR02217 family protein [Agrobacterium tumefaciens]|uniref:TIGR02217 family protein n=1 Tax=Agrobacterium tumefaciens TaxID=358 RepID=UPI000DD6690D|nr:TIGR02217 family protein [Agrobacterium tumefaciens]MCW8056368.1 TIGR02217 family protein [Agrobacterium tumefaciens]MCW8144504.1 TIGR02217 family protein [Agrobacterium tumefaciens]MQB36133.1 TIGR02217 family protein [Agrobacterium tumefaciens]NTA47332.1 TIGR02217 family protein [Agrobacterium tumefaciens]UXT96475.1 TIGR02217 family protein [Agrobacterium tumefaciens]
MAAFHEVRFPLRLALGVSGGPVRRTDIVNLSNGRESRNQRWRNARRSYDAGSGIRSVADLYEVLAFFEARRGELYGFRFRDPVDFKSCPPGETPASTDQRIGTGDGVTAGFQLLKTYADAGGSFTRRIDKPAEGSVIVSVEGVKAEAAAISVDHTTGIVTFRAGRVPPAGAAIRAGFEFDVPVRFAIDRIDVNLTAFEAGRIPSIPLMEILP